MRLRKRSGPGLSFEAFGVRLQLSYDDPELKPRVDQILPPGWAHCELDSSATSFALRQTGPGEYEVTIAGIPALEHGSLEVALTILDSQMRLVIAANAQDRLFVHAGVVSLEGRALVIPGGSFTGKTTLVEALVRAGATYYSDEYALLDDAGRVHPYPRPLSIRSDDGTAARDRRADLIGRVAGDEQAELATVVMTRYQAGAEWRPRRVSTGRGVLALLANTVPAQDRPEESLRTLRRAVAGATTLEGVRGEAAPAAGALLDELASLAHVDV